MTPESDIMELLPQFDSDPVGTLRRCLCLLELQRESKDVDFFTAGTEALVHVLLDAERFIELAHALAEDLNANYPRPEFQALVDKAGGQRNEPAS